MSRLGPGLLLLISPFAWSEDYTPLIVGAVVLPVPMSVEASLNGLYGPDDGLGGRFDANVNCVVWNASYSLIDRGPDLDSRAYVGIGALNWLRVQRGFGDHGRSLRVSSTIPVHFFGEEGNDWLKIPFLWRHDLALAATVSFERYQEEPLRNLFALGVGIIY